MSSRETPWPTIASTTGWRSASVICWNSSNGWTSGGLEDESSKPGSVSPSPGRGLISSNPAPK